MSFSAPAYVSLFLPLAVMLSALLRRSRVYKPWHSLLGLAFLGLSGWQQPLVFLVLVAGNVLAGRLPGHARRVVAVIWNAGAVVLSRLSLPVALPQGISYAAFQALSWHLDDEQGGAMDFAFYLLFFPKQPMGPLTRYQELAAQKPEPAHTWDDAEQGLSRFAWGLFKKVLIADQLAQVTQAVYHSPAADRSPALAVLGLVVFPLQLYMDFSGYTDMALGAARAVGFALPDNFRAPLRADSLRDFWRRWHITLGAWLRDYVYIPLGGSRHGAWRTAVNTGVVYLLMALWHGAGWGFVLWGLWNALILTLERHAWKPETWPVAVRRLYVLTVVAIGFVPFAGAADVGAALDAFAGTGAATWALVQLRPVVLLALLAAVVIVALEGRGLAARLPVWVRRMLVLMLLGVSLLAIYGAAHVPFLYTAY